MRERDRLAQHVQQRGGQRLAILPRRRSPCQPRLDDLQVPVAQLAVDEVVEPEGGMGEVVVLDPRGGVGDDLLQAREDPAVLD